MAKTAENVAEVHVALIDAPHLQRLARASRDHEVVVGRNGAVQDVVLLVLLLMNPCKHDLGRRLLVQLGGETVHVALVICGDEVVAEVAQLHAVDGEVGHVLLTAVCVGHAVPLHNRAVAPRRDHVVVVRHPHNSVRAVRLSPLYPSLVAVRQPFEMHVALQHKSVTYIGCRNSLHIERRRFVVIVQVVWKILVHPLERSGDVLISQKTTCE